MVDTCTPVFGRFALGASFPNHAAGDAFAQLDRQARDHRIARPIAAKPETGAQANAAAVAAGAAADADGNRRAAPQRGARIPRHINTKSIARRTIAGEAEASECAPDSVLIAFLFERRRAARGGTP